MDFEECFENIQHAEKRGFSPPIIALLTYADAENYISVFRDNQVAFEDLSDLSDTDLILMGIDSFVARENILNAIAQLPENTQFSRFSESRDFKIEDISNILSDNIKHFERIYFSTLSTKILLAKNKPEDFMIFPPTMYATDLILKSVFEMEKLLEDMKKELLILKKLSTPVPKSNVKSRKIIIGSIGSIMIAVLSFSLFKSLQNLN